MPQLLDRERVFTSEPPRTFEASARTTTSQVNWRPVYIWTAAKTFVKDPPVVVSSPGHALLVAMQDKMASTIWPFIYAIENLRGLPRDFNGYGSDSPTSESIRLATAIVLRASKVIEPSRVVPSAQGGIVIYFVRGRKSGDIECLNSGDVVATLSDGRNLPEVWEIRESDIKKTLGEISAFLER